MVDSPSRSSGAGVGPWTLVIAAIVLAAVFGRLGVWQLDRLGERRELNRARLARLAQPPLDLALPGEPPSEDQLAWRRVRTVGAWDLDREIVVRGRGYLGSPGVYLVTPLRLSQDRVLLVLRGWLPAADGLSADFGDAAPRPEHLVDATIEGVALPGEEPSSVPPRRRDFGDANRLVLGSLSVEQMATALPYEPLPVIVVAERPEPTGPPLRLVPVPEPSEGPHLLYAVQWFGFAAIALVGCAAYVRTRRRNVAAERSAP